MDKLTTSDKIKLAQTAVPIVAVGGIILGGYLLVKNFINPWVNAALTLKIDDAADLVPGIKDKKDSLIADIKEDITLRTTSTLLASELDIQTRTLTGKQETHNIKSFEDWVNDHPKIIILTNTNGGLRKKWRNWKVARIRRVRRQLEEKNNSKVRWLFSDTDDYNNLLEQLKREKEACPGVWDSQRNTCSAPRQVRAIN